MCKTDNTLKKAALEFEDGARYEGISFGFEKSVAGEAVFNTAMTGYPELLTDPACEGQIIVMTYPIIGNYGVPDDERENGILKFFESDRIRCAGLVVADYSDVPSHWNAHKTLGEWLREQKIPAIYGIDTRELTKKLRDHGPLKAKILFGGDDVEFRDVNSENLAAAVSTKEPKTFGAGKYKVAAVNCGISNSLLRALIDRDMTVELLPWDYDFNASKYDGIFISNGPGDPARCEAAVANIRKALEGNTPIMGVCLGNLLLGRAAGAKTYKLKSGHRGSNQAVMVPNGTRSYITMQNHGYFVDASTLPADWEAMFVNVNDGTNEGIRHRTKPFFGVQFYPETLKDSVDTAFLFDLFVDNIKKSR